MLKNALAREVENCLIASAWIKPETRIINTTEIYKVVNSEAPYGFLNGIFRTNFDSATAQDSIIENYMAYKNLNISFRWYVFPHSRPKNLENLLINLNPKSISEMQGLYIAEKDYVTDLPENTSVEELTAANLEAYAQANCEGWGLIGAQAERVKADIRRDYQKGMNYRAYLARYQGIPAATALLRVVEGRVGFLQGGSCTPQYRGKGLYRALVAKRLSVLKEEKIEMALISAQKNTSAPICKKLGFLEACELRCFNFDF